MNFFFGLHQPVPESGLPRIRLIRSDPTELALSGRGLPAGVAPYPRLELETSWLRDQVSYHLTNSSLVFVPIYKTILGFLFYKTFSNF